MNALAMAKICLSNAREYCHPAATRVNYGMEANRVLRYRRKKGSLRGN